MADHITEEEQIEALKRWWDDNGKQTILAIVLTVGGYFGWQAWTQHVDEQAAAASRAAARANADPVFCDNAPWSCHYR